MKKILSAIILTALVGFGLVAVSSAPASAACPYTACINTTTAVSSPDTIKRGRTARIRTSVTAPGNAVPQGTITVSVVRVKNGRLIFRQTQVYTGGVLTFLTHDLNKKGRYNVTSVFTPAPNSVFNGSSATTSFKVQKTRRR